MKENTLVCYIPTSLNIEALENYNQRWHDKYIWLVHSIVFKSLTNKNSFGGWVNLNADLLRKYIGTRYSKEVINQLIEARVIEYNKSYSVGAFSKSYRLTKEYINASIHAVSLRKPTYERKIKAIRTNYLKDVLSKSDNIKAEFLNLTYARIDKDAAYEYLEATYPRTSKQYQSRRVAIEQYDAMQYADFSNGRWNINFTFKVHQGRIYSPATMLARDLEKFTYFLGYEEQDSAVLDMPNSQLCFYHHLTNKSKSRQIQLTDNQKPQYKVHNIGSRDVFEVDGRVEKIGTPHFGINLIEIKEAKQTPPQTLPAPYVVHFTPKPLIFNSWEECIFNSKGYEAMMFLSKWMGKYTSHTKEERQQFKAEFFGNLFYNKYQPQLTHLEEVFKLHYPNEFKQLRKSKYKLGNKLLAVKVQSLEAKFFHSVVVNYMRRNHINVPYVIKHDSIKLPIEQAYLIHEDINHLAREFFGRADISIKFENV